MFLPCFCTVRKIWLRKSMIEAVIKAALGIFGFAVTITPTHLDSLVELQSKCALGVIVIVSKEKC